MLDRLSTLRRARIHDQLAERTEALGFGEAAYLADHAAQAAALGPAQAARAVRNAQRAGDDAMSAFEYDSAVTWYESVLEHLAAARLDEPEARAASLLALGVAQRSAGRSAFRETLLDAAHLARAAGLVHLQIEATLANTRGTFANARGLDQDRIEMLRFSLTVVPAADTLDPRAALQPGHGAERRARVRGAEGVGAEAVELAPPLATPGRWPGCWPAGSPRWCTS